MERYFDDIVCSAEGMKVFTYDYIEELRAKDKGTINPLRIMAQKGAQEKGLHSNADILIFGGNRGGGKSACLLMEGLFDVFNPNLNALILRNEKDDLDNLKRDAYTFYDSFGKFNKAENDLTWNFHNGGRLKFSYYADSLADFKTRFQGRQYAYIGVDEFTQMAYAKFKYLITCNRNPHGIRNRFVGTCNPDPDSWVRKFIDWWIGKDGDPIPERDGKIRYCFMEGDSPNTIYWGNTPEEVYNQCKDIIDPLWNPALEELGLDKVTMFVKSVTFIRATVEENLILLQSSPEYLANLAQQDEEQRARDLGGNWNYKSAGDDMISQQDMENFFRNPEIEGGRRYVSCDAALEGGDNCVMYLWQGWHIEDIFVCRMDSKSTVGAVKGKLKEWGVLEEHFTYDVQGLGQLFTGFFPRAKKFNGQAAVDKDFKHVYENIKSQCAYKFQDMLIKGELSINPRLLTRRYSGNGYEGMELKQILLRERKAIRADDKNSDKGFAIIRKDTMKKLVGHSPDFIEGLLMRMIFDLKESKGQRPRSMPRIVRRYSF